MGGTWKIPVMEGLQSKSFVAELKLAGTYNDASFEREYASTWSGDAENAFFSAETFDKHRQLLQPEWEFSGRGAKTYYYVLGVDVGRLNCTTEVAILKVSPQAQGAALKSLVNLYSYEATDFEEQAIAIKKLFYKYRARQVVIDANGLGVGLVDFMTKAQIDPDSNEELPPFGISGGTNPDSVAQYKNIRGGDVEENAMYLMKANAPINTECHSYVQTQLSSGKIKFLIDENQATVKLMSTKVGQQMDSDRRAEYLKPFVMTTALREQLLNLTETNEGVNIILKQASKGTGKDKFSALEYGLYWIKQEEDKHKRTKRTSLKDFMFFN